MRPKDELLDAIVPCGDRQQHRADRRMIAHIAAGQKGQRAKAHAASDEIAAIDVLDESLVFLQSALIDRLFGPKHRPRWGTVGVKTTGRVRNSVVAGMQRKGTRRAVWKS